MALVCARISEVQERLEGLIPRLERILDAQPATAVAAEEGGDPVAEMRAALRVMGGPALEAVEDHFLRYVLASAPAPPGLRGEANVWGWDDAEVRGRLASHVAAELVGRRWPKETGGAAVEAFLGELLAAHRAWCDRRPGIRGAPAHKGSAGS
ncbi:MULTISPECIES: hypothetical protein [unclassified Streptomyces]|uniref:Uncharacterized protein n=1 Tax=Streptomyces sp. NBC_00060 TaxID=2975636 RepID=A0AAU2HCS0_9ACTN